MTTVADDVAGLQIPGTEVEIHTPGGARVRLEDPREVVHELCEYATREDPPTDPWPVDGEGEPQEFVRSEVAEAIGEELIARLVRLAGLRDFTVHYLFRNKETWEKQGKTVFGEMKKTSGLFKEYAKADFVVLLNRNVWQRLNPMQRVALVYHELRHGGSEDGKPKARPHDFEGFFDELEIFGTATYEDWNKLAQSTSEGRKVTHQFSLGLLD